MARASLHPLLHYLRRLGVRAEGDPDDVRLLHRFLSERDEDAFAAIVRRYGAMVWSLCVRRLGQTPEAEDAFQATFLVLVKKASSLRGPELLGPWLHGVAIRTALKASGRRARQAARETPLREQPAEERPEQVWSDLRPVIDEEVNRLPERYRRPVVLCYLQGLSSEEAAARLGCAKGTVFSRLSRARDLLRRRLAKRGLGVTAGTLAAVLAEQAAAGVPPSGLSEATVRLGHLFAAGAAGQVLPGPLAALVDGVLRSMFLNKIQFVAVVLLVFGLAGSGAGFLAHRTSAEPPRAAAPAAANEAKAKDPKDEAKPKADANEAFVVAVPDRASRLKTWREKLAMPVQFPGYDDPKGSLNEALDAMAKRYNLTFRVNERAFKFENVQEVGKTEIASPPIPVMKASLATVLKAVLARVPVPSGAMFVLRKDYVEITTTAWLEIELGRLKPPDDPPITIEPKLSLVWDAFEDTPVTLVLQRLADAYDLNLVTDPRVTKQLQTKATAQFNNVPVDTALRLLLNMADVSMVRMDNVYYLTTAENAKRLREDGKAAK